MIDVNSPVEVEIIVPAAVPVAVPSVEVEQNVFFDWMRKIGMAVGDVADLQTRLADTQALLAEARQEIQTLQTQAAATRCFESLDEAESAHLPPGTGFLVAGEPYLKGV
jgi:hypothetical protein